MLCICGSGQPVRPLTNGCERCHARMEALRQYEEAHPPTVRTASIVDKLMFKHLTPGQVMAYVAVLVILASGILAAVSRLLG